MSILQISANTSSKEKRVIFHRLSWAYYSVLSFISCCQCRLPPGICDKNLQNVSCLQTHAGTRYKAAEGGFG